MIHLMKISLKAFVFLGWASGMSYMVAIMMVGHWVGLPVPDKGSQLRNAELLSPIDSKDYQAIHFLFVDCPCSVRILNKLSQRSPLDSVSESIVLIGESEQWQQAMAAQGFETHSVIPSELKSKFGIESAPLLVVTDQDGFIRYAGGYTSRKQGPDIQDVAVIERVLSGEQFDSLPLYGCAVSKELQQLVDPLGLK